MVKKLTIVMASAFMAAASVAYAPVVKQYFPFAKEKQLIVMENLLEKYVQEGKKNIEKIEKKIHMLQNYETDDFNEDSDQILIARLMLGEDEEHPDICKIADVSTAQNRANRNNTDIRTEILRPWAYSCFWREDSKTFLKTPLNYSPLEYTQEFPRDLELAKNFLAGKYKDPTHGATSYFNPDGLEGGIIRFVKGLGRMKTPRDWDMNSMIFTVKIGDHYYFKERN